MLTKKQHKLLDQAEIMLNKTLGKWRINEVDEAVQYETFAMIIDKIDDLAKSDRDNKAIETAKILKAALDAAGIYTLPYWDEDD